MENPRRIKLIGDRQEAIKKYGEGQALLRLAKTISELIGIPFFRLFSADRRAMSQSIHGMQDQITLLGETPPSISLEMPSCSVILYNVPTKIPPMMWYYPGTETFTKAGDVWVIRKPNGDLEVEGIDYIKTYYSAGSMDCPGCELDFTLGKDIWAITASTSHRPFIYKAEKDDGSLIYNYGGSMVPHFMGYSWTDPPTPADPLNHTIHSFWAHAEAEIIKFDSDSGGTYFLWKAYTEWSNIGPHVVDFTRTGLGYMLMKGLIKNGGDILCDSKGHIIKVDCCEKPIADRTIKLWYEEGTGPFMFYGATKLYEVPEVIHLWLDLYANACIPMGGVLFYSLPDINGSCLPVEWIVEGRGEEQFEAYPHPTDQYGYFKCPDPNPYEFPDCNDVILTVRDRCGTEDHFIATCCDWDQNGVWEPPIHGLGIMTIQYTSLSMKFGEEQFLVALGGCPPYSWSCTGAGSISVDPTRPMRDWATYTAPLQNPECANDDRVTVIDCCGTGSVEINLTVTTDTPYTAFQRWHWLYVGNPWGACESLNPRGWNLYYDYYYCDGSHQSGPHLYGTFFICEGGDPRGGVACCIPCSGTICATGPGGCACSIPGPGYYGCDGSLTTTPFEGQIFDCRTPAMKTAGCCPINPDTGLPL